MEDPTTADLPTVATIIGCPEQLSDTNGLVATPLGVPGTEASEEAIQKALLENFCGSFMSKKDRFVMRCEICDITCTGEHSFQAHTAGAKHIKKVKEKEEHNKTGNPPFIQEDPETKTFECVLCQVKLNAKNQIAAHVSGMKHKTRLGPNEKLYSAAPRELSSGQDLSTSLLYCPTCNVHTNSSLQMDQHMTSAKHVNKVNGGINMGPPPRRPFGPPGFGGGPPGRFMPYNFKERESYEQMDRREMHRRDRLLPDPRNHFYHGDGRPPHPRGDPRAFAPQECYDHPREMNRGYGPPRGCNYHPRDGRGGVWMRERLIEQCVEDRYVNEREYYHQYYQNRNEYNPEDYYTRRGDVNPRLPRLQHGPMGYSF